MDDALLDLRLRVYSLYGLREAAKPVHAGDQDVLHTTVFQAIQDGKPEFGTFIFANIHSQDVLFPVHVNTGDYIDGAFYNAPLAANMAMDGIHKYDRIDFLQRAFLPFPDNGKYLVRDPADCAVGYIHVVEFFHVGFYVAGCHAFCIHGKNLFLHVLRHGILVFFNELWLILAVAVARDCNIHVSIAGVHDLLGMSVAAVVRVLVPVIIL